MLFADLVYRFGIATGVRSTQTGPLRDEDAVRQTIEAVVEGTDSKLRVVAGYRQKLRGSVISLIEYLDRLVDDIPSPLELSQRAFGVDPQINAFFASYSDIRRILSQCEDLKGFFGTRPVQDVREAYAFLCMYRKEKTVLGAEWSGQLLRREVAQTTVNFLDHRLFSPCETEEAARCYLRKCLFNSLLQFTRQRLLHLKSERQALEDRKGMLTRRLRSLRAEAKRGGMTSDRAAEQRFELNDVENQLADVEKGLAEAGIDLRSPEACLDEVRRMLDQADEYLRIDNKFLKVSRMGIKLEDGSLDAANELNLSEVEVGNQPGRVVVLVKCPREEFDPKDDFFDKASSYLGVH